MQLNNSRRGRPPRQSVYQRLNEAVTELRDRMGGLPSPTEAEDIWTSIWYQEAHQSTALEGNTLVIEQVEALLAQGLAVGNKELRDRLRQRREMGLWTGARSRRLGPGRSSHADRSPSRSRTRLGASVERRAPPQRHRKGTPRQFSATRHPAIPRRHDTSLLGRS